MTSLHISSEIHSFLCRSLPWVFGTALRRDSKIPSSLVDSVGGRSGDFRLPVMYRVCSRSGALRKQRVTIKWLVLCRGSRTDTFLKRLLSVPRRYSVWDLLTLPSRTMLHVCLYLPHLRLIGRKCAVMSSTSAAAIAAVISVPLILFSKSSRPIVKVPCHYQCDNFGSVPERGGDTLYC